MSAWRWAPGGPGEPPTWTTGAKSGVGTARSAASRVWFTLSNGVLNEIYYPRIDRACTRMLALVVTDGQSFVSDESTATEHAVAYLAGSVPGYHLTNTCCQGRYCIEKEIVADPRRDAVLQHTCFEARQGRRSDYHLYVLLSPHLANYGTGNTAWVGDYKGRPMLFAQREESALALACSAPFLKCSVGFAGRSGGWQDLQQHGQMTWEYTRAEDGNVVLAAEVDLEASDSEFTLALGFGLDFGAAGLRAAAALQRPFAAVRKEYVRQWRHWRKTWDEPGGSKSAGGQNLFGTSMWLLNVHESKDFLGGIIASLAIPWGFARGDNNLGGYHLVWPRDLVEAAGGELAGGVAGDAHRVLHYLRSTQEANGRWPQNMWMNGLPYGDAVQLDEAALPILLVALVAREHAFARHESAEAFWPMVRRAAGYIVRRGPATQQDRWEELPGYTPFTLATEIAALLAAAELAGRCGEWAVASYLRQTADAWNAQIEAWTYARDTELAHQVGVDGYYVRITPQTGEGGWSLDAGVPLVNKPGRPTMPAWQIVSPDALALVRFGLRAPDDPRILNTIKVIDALLKVDTPAGPAWHRFNGDGYGEKEDGAPYDGTGIGRVWPLLTGERAHYELAAGNRKTAECLLQAMANMANQAGLLPEQVWDTGDIPERELWFGRPTGSAMPLVWAHAEYIKLRRSLHAGRVFDMPREAARRYIKEEHPVSHVAWRFTCRPPALSPGQTLRVETMTPAQVRWSADNWQTHCDETAQDTGLGVYAVDLPTAALQPGQSVSFTFFWPEAGHWEDCNFVVPVR
jgi:glucoamylase